MGLPLAFASAMIPLAHAVVDLVGVFSRRICPAAMLLAISCCAHAASGLWQINEIYSKADGSVQFIELITTYGGTLMLRGTLASLVTPQQAQQQQQQQGQGTGTTPQGGGTGTTP